MLSGSTLLRHLAQFYCAIYNPISTFVIPMKALGIAQIEKAQAKAPAFVRCGQTQ